MKRSQWIAVTTVGAMLAIAGSGTVVAQLHPIVSLDGPAIPGGPSPTLAVVPAGQEDLLATATPPPAPAPPALFVPGAALGIVGGGAGGADLDAVSFGRTLNELFGGASGPPFYYCSVDRLAAGLAGAGAPPDVFSEALIAEASGDVFFSPVPGLPLANPPGMVAPGLQMFDGDGIGSFQGMGLIEPAGDDIDAMDLMVQMAATPHIYFSLDPFVGAPANFVLPGDVLVAPGGVGPFVIFAPAAAIGLDMMGPGSDDLDALVVIDVNADAVYQPGADVVLFSVRTGSAIVGAPDCLFGAPITEGDVLIDAPAAVALFGGAATGLPGICFPAEAIGLQTMRLGLPNDDLDALDVIAWNLQDQIAGAPPYNGTLPKTQNNVIELVFPGAIAIAPGPPNPVTIQQLITSNPQVLGPDLSGSFTYSVTTTNVVNDTLKCKENGAVLVNQTWYRVMPTATLVDAATGVSVAPGFGLGPYDLCTLQGDADDSGQVLALDYFQVKNNLFAVTDARYDLDGSGQVLALDYFVVKNNLFAATPAKP